MRGWAKARGDARIARKIGRVLFCMVVSLPAGDTRPALGGAGARMSPTGIVCACWKICTEEL
jgi:hypothetical protein